MYTTKPEKSKQCRCSILSPGTSKFPKHLSLVQARTLSSGDTLGEDLGAGARDDRGKEGDILAALDSGGGADDFLSVPGPCSGSSVGVGVGAGVGLELGLKLELELELGDLRCSGWCCCARCVC